MWEVNCKGTPYEIGYQHGRTATHKIKGSIDFYAALFLKYTKRQWPQVRETASSFARTIKVKWPKYHREMEGIAAGAQLDILDIIALNVRTEIAFGLFSDGCTSLSWKTEKSSLLGQNWDWMEEQKQNLILLTISQEGLPTIRMVTEAGIIGKIGLNSDMVGVCLNAVKATGLDPSRLPVHLGLRMALESTSAEEAAQRLERWGMASSAHILVADVDGSIGLEFTSNTMARLNMDEHGRVYHSNNFLVEHPGAHEIGCGPDSPFRAERIRALTKEFDDKANEPSLAEFTRFFDDHANFPCSICRAREGFSEDATLFNIVMDLKGRRAVVLLGKVCQVEERIEFDFKGE